MMKRLTSFSLLANSVHRNKQFNHYVDKSKAPLEYISLPQSYTQIIHAGQYELNEMQGLTLAHCTGSLQLYLRLGCSMKKSMLPLAWMCRPCAPCIPLSIFDTANGEKMRGIDLAVVSEDMYLQ